jgi:hypothetical protein
MTSGTAKDLVLKVELLFVANGSSGVDMIDVSDPANPFIVDTYNTSGYAAQIAANNSILAVADWDDVEILSFSTSKLELAGFKKSLGRVMAIAVRNDVVFSAEWSKLTTYEYGEISGPDVDYSDRKIEFPRVAGGASHILSFTMQNSGQSTLVTNDFVQNNDNFIFDFPLLELEPGASQEISVTYNPQDTQWTSVANFWTNDLDELNSQIVSIGNSPYGPMPGDPAPYFNLNQIDDNGYISLNDIIGQPTVIAFFTAW